MGERFSGGGLLLRLAPLAPLLVDKGEIFILHKGKAEGEIWRLNLLEHWITGSDHCINLTL